MSDERFKATDVESYRTLVLMVVNAGHVLRMYDIPAALEAIEKADTLGPFLDPTLWRDKHAAMEQDRALLKAALPLWNAMAKLEAAVAERSP